MFLIVKWKRNINSVSQTEGMMKMLVLTKLCFVQKNTFSFLKLWISVVRWRNTVKVFNRLCRLLVLFWLYTWLFREWLWMGSCSSHRHQRPCAAEARLLLIFCLFVISFYFILYMPLHSVFSPAIVCWNWLLPFSKGLLKASDNRWDLFLLWIIQ